MQKKIYAAEFAYNDAFVVADDEEEALKLLGGKRSSWTFVEIGIAHEGQDSRILSDGDCRGRV